MSWLIVEGSLLKRNKSCPASHIPFCFSFVYKSYLNMWSTGNSLCHRFATFGHFVRCCFSWDMSNIIICTSWPGSGRNLSTVTQDLGFTCHGPHNTQTVPIIIGIRKTVGARINSARPTLLFHTIRDFKK